MSEEKKEQEVQVDGNVEAPTGVDATGSDVKGKEGKRKQRGNRSGARRTDRRNVRKGSRFGSRPKPEFEQKIINISRVTRVVKGGRRLSFRVDMVIGDGKGRVGLGSGKATDTSFAIQKAYQKAKKNLKYLKLTKTNSIPYEVEAKVTSSVVHMFPNKGRGLVAGSTVRNVLQLAGITDVTAKLRSRSKNRLNNAKAAIKALEAFQMSDEEVRALQEKRRQRSQTGGNGKVRKRFVTKRGNGRRINRGGDRSQNS